MLITENWYLVKFGGGLVSIQDEALAERVRNALIQDKRVGGQAIAVRVVQGEVFLKGIVDTEEQRELAVMVARGIPGVRYLNIDELRVREATK
jgi:osmotically-inducible protein OsmY